MTKSSPAPWKAKLTAEQVMEMRAEYLAGETDYAAMGQRYGVVAGTVRDAVTGKNWKHLPYQLRPPNYPTGDRHWSRRTPESVPRGEGHWKKAHPESSHGGISRGEGHYNARLTEADVLEIRRAYAAGEGNQTQLAERWGVSNDTVHAIVKRKLWKHLSPDSGEDAGQPGA